MEIQNIQQFNIVQQRIAEDNLVFKLTNARPLGNRHDVVRERVLNGYAKIMAFVNKGVK